MRERNIHIAVALDGMRKADMLSLAHELWHEVEIFKVNDALHRYGSRVVGWLKPYGRVFADAKLNDTWRTVQNETQVYNQAGANLLTVHARGEDVLASALDITKTRKKLRLEIIAVTELTSEKEDLGTKGRVLQKAACAVRAGLTHVTTPHSVVPWIRRDRQLVDGSLVCVVPGVRPTYASEPRGQEQVATPADIIRAAQGHNVILVIGTPVLESHKYGMSPKEMVRRIKHEMQEAIAQLA